MPISFRSRPAFVSVVSGSQSYDRDIRVDVIAVPAVGADPVSTWRTGDDTGSKSWLEEDLLTNLPVARVLFYDHGHPADGDGLAQLAHRLLHLLLTIRDGPGPVLAFMCHSTGGLVVKQALFLARNDDRYRCIVDATVGIAFFAVPHRGSELLSNPSFSAKAQKAANAEWSYDKPRRQPDKGNRCYRFQLPSRLCRELKILTYEAPKEGEIREVSYLLGLSGVFHSLLGSIKHELKIWSYYEDIQAGLAPKLLPNGSENWFQIEDDLIVSAESAKLHGESPDVGLPCDHYGTASFDTMYPKMYARTQDWRFPDRKYKASLIQQLHIVVSEWYAPILDPARQNTAETMYFISTRIGMETSSVRRSVRLLLDQDFGDFLDPPKDNDLLRPDPVYVRPLTPSRVRNDAEGWKSSFKSSKSLQSLEGKRNKVHWLSSKPDMHRNAGSDTGVTPYSEVDPSRDRIRCQFRWVHVPYTHTELVKNVLQGIIEQKPVRESRLKLLKDVFWSKKQNTATHPSPHARFLQSTCILINDVRRKKTPPKEPLELPSEQTIDYSTAPSTNISREKEKKHVDDVPQMVLYLPFLHWESFQKLDRREMVIQERIKSTRYWSKKVRGRRTNLGSSERYPEAETIASSMIGDVATFKKIRDCVQTSPELSFLWHHVAPGDQLHCRRSLDQYMYPSLPDTSERDSDQILHKCTRKGRAKLSDDTLDHDYSDDEMERLVVGSAGSSEVDETGSVLVVDQLWMWVMDDGTVVSSFPPNEVDELKNKDTLAPAYSSAVHIDPPKSVLAKLVAAGDLKTCIQQEIKKSKNPFNNEWELAAFIVRHVVSALFNAPENGGLHVLRHFAEHIDKLVEKQATSWASLRLRSGLGLTDSIDEIDQLLQDLRDLRELRDVADELRIIDKVLGEQNTHIKEMRRIYDNKPGARNSKGVRYLKETLFVISQQQEQVRQMQSNTKIATDGFDELIVLKQSQISIDQAVDAGKQSRAVTVFTVFTVFFLPLSFFTSLYGMNVQEWGGNPGTVTVKVILSTMLPLSFLVIASAFLFAMKKSFRDVATSIMKPLFEIIFECLIIAIEFVAKWSGIFTLWAWLGKSKNRIGIGWIYAFRDSIKKHKLERRIARDEARVRKKKKKTNVLEQASVISGSEVTEASVNGNETRRKWRPFRRPRRRHEGALSGSERDEPGDGQEPDD